MSKSPIERLMNSEQLNVYRWFKFRVHELNDEAKYNGGLRRSDLWRLSYYERPYLLLIHNSVVRDRFIDTHHNMIDIDACGQIIPIPILQNDAKIIGIYTHLLEEMNWRGLNSPDLFIAANEEIGKYFSRGKPPGIKLFESVKVNSERCIVKHSKRKYIQDMLNDGLFRISPASYYAKGSHLKAVKDLETVRPFYVNAFDLINAGQSSLIIEDKEISLSKGFFPINMKAQDYYLFCTCREIDRRLPTDFESDAALIITEPDVFLDRMRKVFSNILPGWNFDAQPVHYCDPYQDMPQPDDKLHFWKHFSFSYQKEHRFVLMPPIGARNNTSLSPIDTKIGSIKDIAHMVSM